MKFLLGILTLMSFLSLFTCQRDVDSTSQDDEKIERQEDYRRDDIIERRNLETPDQLDLDRDVMDLDDLKLDQ